jgi:hypothetical protein
MTPKQWKISKTHDYVHYVGAIKRNIPDTKLHDVKAMKNIKNEKFHEVRVKIRINLNFMFSKH